MTTVSAAAAGTFTIGAFTDHALKVNRLGYGAMRITGDGIWGPPKDKPAALATLRRAVELDINLIDTADSYGPNVSEELIAEALFPYPAGLVIATKGGWERVGPGQWIHNASPRHLDRSRSKARLKTTKASPHRHLPAPRARPRGLLRGLRRRRSRACASKARSATSRSPTSPGNTFKRAQKIVPIVSVQNRYSFADRESDFIVDFCEQQGIAFFPWAPLGQAREAHDAIKKEAESSARNAAASRACMAAQALEGHHPHPRHLQRQAS